MATNITVSSNYAGKVAGEIIGKAFKEADTIAKNLITVMPDIDYQASLRKIAYSDGRTDYSCGFTPAGAVTLSEVVLAPKKIKNDMEICKEDLRQIWSSATMGFSAKNDSMPKDVETALLAEILADTAENLDYEIWNGDSATSGQIGGFVPLFTADSGIIKANNGITALNAATTKANVISHIEVVLNAIPVALRRKSDLIIGVANNVALAYQQALVSAGISNGLGGGDMELRYGNYKLDVINGLEDNTFVVYQRKNLYFGTGLMADHNEVRFVDQDESSLTGTVRGKMVYTGGVQYVNPEEIIWLLTTTA